MSENSESQDKLTLADLERYLVAPIVPGTGSPLSRVRAASVQGLTPYLDAAAVLHAFDPFSLQPTPGGEVGMERLTLLDEILPLSEQNPDGPQRGLWSLLFAERRAALRRLATREKIKEALEANPSRPDTPVQRMFERVVDGATTELARLTRDELAALITVIDWTAGILNNLAEKGAVGSALARADLLAPMRRLAERGFVNRQSELEQLQQYVFGDKQQAPLFVFGPGGVGKSTLLARFILQSTEARPFSFAYIDIDRPTIRPDQPQTLLVEAIAQLRLQFDLPPGAAESLITEITFGLGRQDEERALESLGAGYGLFQYLSLFQDFVHQYTGAKQIVAFFVDTFEEAQFLGPDVVSQLLDFLSDLNESLDNIRVILSGRALPPNFIAKAFPELIPPTGFPWLEDELVLERIPLLERPIDVGILEQEPARELLQKSLLDVGLLTLTSAELDDVIGVVSRNPMCLKLAARLLREEGIKKLREERSEFLVKLKAEKIQALLYGRILQHLHNDDVRKVAYPGLVVRRIDPDVIRDVLAGPCGLKLTPERNEWAIFVDLSKEAALVEPDPLDGSLRHRADVRRAMLEDLTDHVDAEVVNIIDNAAVDFYFKRVGAVARAEEIYHRLRLRQGEEILNARWSPDAADRLKAASEELPAQQRLWLAQKLGITLDPAVREQASQEAWEDQAMRTANRFLQSGKAAEALTVLSERSQRLPRSQLYALESEAYRFLNQLDEAIRVAQSGVDALSKAGAVDMSLDLQLKMVNIEETRRNLQMSEQRLDEAKAMAGHSRNDALRLRVQITELRIQRQLRPDAVNERERLLRAALANVTDDMLFRLRSQPVLLREVAAELGYEDARISRAAVDTLGLEAATDGQARALAYALSTLNSAQAADKVADRTLASAVEQFQQANYDPAVIRNWVTATLTTSEIQSVSQRLSTSAPRSEVLRDFQTYFRAGVESALRIST
jgi:GTPase SAR1 family protein